MQSQKMQEKKLGKTHQATLTALINMTSTYMVGLKDYPKAEEKYRRALNEHERTLDTRTPWHAQGT